MCKKIIETYNELDFTVSFQNNNHSVDFNAYEIAGRYSKNNKDFTIPFYLKSNNDETENINEAKTMIRGTVKWDGCSHYYFGDCDGYMYLYGKTKIKNIQEIIKKIHVRCGELMDNLDKDEF